MKSLLVQKIVATEAMGDKQFLEQRGRVYTFLNPVSYLDALEHKALFERFDGVFADGSLLVAAIRLLYGKTVTRRSCDWTSVGRELFLRAEQTGETIFLLGSKQDQVERAVEVLQERCPKARIVGNRNGYFRGEAEQEEAIKEIIAAHPDFLIVGMGILKQEQFLLKAREMGFEGTGFTCGGFIHQTAKNEGEYYPAWVDRTNLRFLYRMYKEPHTRKRYLMAGLIFPVRFVWERLFARP